MFKLNLPPQVAIKPVLAKDLKQGQLFVVDDRDPVNANSVCMAVAYSAYDDYDMHYIYPFCSQVMTYRDDLLCLGEHEKVYPVTAVVSELKLDTDQ